MKTTTATPAIFTNSSLWHQLKSLSLLIIGCFFIMSCSSENKNTESEQAHAPAINMPTEETGPADDGKGIGPVKDVQLAAIDQNLAEHGKTLYDAKCAACHQMTEQKVVGPGLKGVTERRKPEWIMNMIVNPEEMTKKDPTAKKLLAEHLTQMTNQNVTQEDARAMLEYFRVNDQN